MGSFHPNRVRRIDEAESDLELIALPQMGISSLWELMYPCRPVCPSGFRLLPAGFHFSIIHWNQYFLMPD
ncbi:MAG: hypothetical protein JWM11_4784 [Planctomycetaceae bacterium]|nr:hypothetical protein [Planctomycetaceae bacterium]